ncbi:MAG: Phosphoribosyl-AMP cyclohydrolase, partial [uncultured Nocardioides sp.]
DRPRPRHRRPAQAHRRRAGARRGAAARVGGGADAGLDGRRGARAHAGHRAGDVLEPEPSGVLGQGRHLRPRAARARGPPRLRRRHPPGHRRPGGRGLPHRRPHLLRRRRPARGAAGPWL